MLDLDLMNATDRQMTDIRRASLLNAPYCRGGSIITTFIGIRQPRGWIKSNNIRSIHLKLELALRTVQSI